MKRHRPAWMAVIAAAALSLQGCAVLLLGTGVAAGLAVSDDMVQTDTERPPQFVYRMAKQELEQAGRLVLDDAKALTLKAQVDEADVTVTVAAVSDKITRLRVKARKNLLPNIDLAHRLSTAIGKRL